jgi:DNA-binding winged helix-turn-helix (wHTH) protein
MTQPSDIFTFGPFRLDVASRTLARDGEAVTLTAKAFDTLLVLIRHRDQVVDKEQLVKLVWPDTFVSDDSLTHSVSVLRRVLGDDSAQPVYIATIPRRGYRFTAPVNEEHVGAADARAPESDVPPTHPLPRDDTRRSKSIRTWAYRLWPATLMIPVAAAMIAFAPRLVSDNPLRPGRAGGTLGRLGRGRVARRPPSGIRRAPA